MIQVKTAERFSVRKLSTLSSGDLFAFKSQMNGNTPTVVNILLQHHSDKTDFVIARIWEEPKDKGYIGILDVNYKGGYCDADVVYLNGQLEVSPEEYD